MRGSDKEGLYLECHQKHYNCIIIGFAGKKKGEYFENTESKLKSEIDQQIP